MRAATVCLGLALLVLPAAADTLVLKGGKKREGVFADAGDAWVLNPYNSRCPSMTYGIPPENRFPKDKLETEPVIADPPLVEYRERSSRPGVTTEERAELAKFCEKHKLAEERDREWKLVLAADPSHAEALAAVGKLPWATWSKGNPLADSRLRELEREYVKLTKPDELDAAGRR